MKIPIPFTRFGINIEKRGITFVDRKTSLPIDFDIWRNKFSIKKSTPILENIYQTIASEFSKIDLVLTRDPNIKTDDSRVGEINIKQRNNPNYEVLALRPNILQTKSEFLYTMMYQLQVYGNALATIQRKQSTDRNIVDSITPLNMEDYLFGQGFMVDGSVYLKLKDKKSNQIVLLDYNDTIHLRLNPNDIFYGDESSMLDVSNFTRLFDENLNVLLNELKNAGTVNGVVTIGGGITGGGFNDAIQDTDTKSSKQQEIIDRIKSTNGGILVLDAGEEWTSLSKTFKTMSVEELDNLIKYVYNFKGINEKVINGTASEAEMSVFFNKSIMPIIERLIEELNYKFLTQTARTQGQKIEAFKNPFEYMGTKDLLDSLYKGAMFFSQNEIRHMAFKLSPITGGDVLMDNKNFDKTLNTLKGGDEQDGKQDN